MLVVKMTYLSIALSLAMLAQRAEPDATVDKATSTQVVARAVEELQKSYVFPDVAARMKSAMEDHLKRGDYDRVTSARELSRLLTTHLQEISHDKHLRVNFSPEPIPLRREQSQPTADEVARFREQGRRINWGFEKLERLEGNVGYIDLRGFMPATESGPTVIAAMNFLSNVDALIVDLRKNGGGDPATVALLTTYLFSDEDVVHLNSLYWRPSDSTHQWWTLPYVPGKRLAGVPVYVLTARRTFSAAEEFTYNLKSLKRATIVGETTGGGAHPGGGVRLTEHFGMFVPSGRAINPITQKNWEGTGVEPHVAVTAELALKTAHLDALQKLVSKASDPRVKTAMEDAILMLKTQLSASK